MNWLRGLSVRLAEPLDQATGLRRLFAAGPAFRSVGVIGPDARRNARVSMALAQGLGHRGSHVLVLDEGKPPYNVGGMMGLLAKRSLADAWQVGLADVTVDAGAGVRLLAAQDGVDALAGLSEHDLHDMTENWQGDAPEWMLVSSGDTANGGGLASTAELRILVLPGDKNWLAEAYAVLKSSHAAGTTGTWVVLVEGADIDAAQRLYNSLQNTTQRFLGVAPGYLGCLPRVKASQSADESFHASLLAESMQNVQTENPMNFEQYWQRLWLFSRMALDPSARKSSHAGRHTR